MKVYADDMLVKSLYAADRVNDLNKIFTTLREYKMMLNPKKCPFRLNSGKFLGYMVSQRGNEAHSNNIKVVTWLVPSNSIKKVHSLTC